MSSKYLLAVDPGKATGISLFDVTNELDPKLLWTKEADVPYFYSTVETTIANHADEIEVVCENYIITSATAKKSQAPWSLRGCGVLDFLCLKYGVKFTLQTPVDAKNFCDNDRLRSLGFWHVGGEGHANDSMRHAVLYLSRTRPKWNKLLLRAILDKE